MLAVALCWWASGLFFPGRAPSGAADDVPRSMRFLSRVIAEGAADDMQRLFPEGHLFTHVTTGLAAAELGLQAAPGSAARADGLSTARAALAALDSEQGRAPFNRHLDPPRGVFYRGWVAYLSAKIIALEGPDPRLVASLERDGDAIAAALARAPTPYLPSYTGMAWPTDTVVAVAALSLHDQVLPPRYGAARQAWLARAKATLDPAMGLFPHQVDPDTGAVVDGPRGTSSALISAFLPDIDRAFAAELYPRYRARFVVTRLGLPGVRERANEADPWRPLLSEGDIDSGPLLAGLSMSASTVALAAAANNGDPELAEGLRRAAELAGLPTGLTEKRYLFGMLPVADGFLAWCRALPIQADARWPPILSLGGRAWALLFTLACLFALIGRPLSDGRRALRALRTLRAPAARP